MNVEEKFLGLVKDGLFRILDSKSGSGNTAKLSEKPLAMGMPTKELDIKKYEGKALLIEGDHIGNYIYSVKIIDEAGPIVSALVEKTFSKKVKGK